MSVHYRLTIVIETQTVPTLMDPSSALVTAGILEMEPRVQVIKQRYVIVTIYKKGVFRRIQS